MATEKIEKAARSYVKDSYGDCIPQEHSFNIAINAFKEGFEFANKHWQEKTRWISVGERLPEVRETPYWVVAKTESGDDYVMVNIKNEGFFEYLKTYFTYWKEIEL